MITNPTTYLLGSIYTQACRKRKSAYSVLTPGLTEACEAISSGLSGECFCTGELCNSVYILNDFLQNYQNGILDCYGSKHDMECPESEESVCYISKSAGE